MADKKISQLSSATVPLAGTEVLPVVQSGSTVKVSVDALTTGRTVKAAAFDTDVAAAKVTLSGTTLAAVGTDTNINLLLTPKGSGGVGVGTASPEQKLHVAGGSNTYFATQRTTASTSALVIGSESGKNSVYSWTTPTGASGVPLGFTIGSTEVMNLDASANATIGGGTLATSATDGFLYVPTCAGTPTGTPTAKSGYAPIVVDTTNNKLYFYSGGQWRDAGP